MRTLNKHPQWQNQPLRLNSGQLRNPSLIIHEFFDCFHLQEVREILWAWTVEVVSSERSIASEAVDRSNHIFFYEKIEALVEATLVIKRKQEKRSRKRMRQQSLPKVK